MSRTSDLPSSKPSVAEQAHIFDVDRPIAAVPASARWGSDLMAEMLRALGVEFIALTPGASFRGLHDSLVNHLGNVQPEMLLAVHEENAVAIAHGYARVTGRPMAVALHSNVGLMHATMAIFNAWCDRVPILLLGGVGPMDAVQRRPWVDWIHTARDLGALVRGYTKWDDQPGSVAATLEALVRAYQIAVTPPQAPVYVCLDASLQEQVVDAPIPLPPLDRFRLPSAARIEDWQRRVELAERLDARVLTDLKTGAMFPTTHRLHPFPPGIFASGDAASLIREADVILSLDWIDLAGALKLACGGQWPTATVVQCSLDQYLHNGWSMDYQGLPVSDVAMLASPDALVRLLLERIPERRTVRETTSDEPPAASAQAAPAASSAAASGNVAGARGLSIEALARITSEVLAKHNPSYIRLPLGWPGQYCRFAHPLDYIGFDGAGGIGSGPGMAVGAALALRHTDRLAVAVLGDGDYLMGVTAVWTGVHYHVPVLIIVANNHSFFNDELHQERTARVRGRPIENRWIGMRLNDPPLDLARLAQGQGAVGVGPLDSEESYASSLAASVEQVKAGATCVIDVQVVPEYARTVSSALLRHIPGEQKQ
jgi:thiamine pyrophosphate-dependent acetolactate synthase large subunit-like protein